ncbi:prohibitin family protein [Psychroflexus sediminis]|uniref:Regulator of protease activity HflC, stomatin/prohibitin superfamily n=1 Tax=Psychroflexus sediminis TaxID=470826 RepID=A0A1G7VY38_9FLAO|nr:prohibitin family protein [Psychroflexus sediminis]SDG64672.1 Regulator of protease activity HflC, stomatin/prohibitin superfamily [Psychroflexus sediminis]
MKLKAILSMALAAAFLSSCAVIRPGEVGVRQRLGKLSEKPVEEGVRFFNPLTTTFVKVLVRTNNVEQTLLLPSKEGLTIVSEVSVLYSIEKDKAPIIIKDIGKNFERDVLINTLRSSSANISAKYFAKDMHSRKRNEIENAIQDNMNAILKEKGFEIQAVLLKSINLPARLSSAIEDKLRAEQQFQEMEFIVQREIKEAERKRAEATGIRDAQAIINEGLSPMLIQYQSIEAFRELSRSPNAKIIITDGKAPVMLNTN